MGNPPRPPVSPEQRLLRRESRSSSTYKAFLKNLSDKGRMSEEIAEAAAVSVLCALEQRLVGGEASDLEAQLPLKLQNLLARCERHHGEVPAKFGREEFLAMVGEDLGMQSSEVEGVVRAVFAAVRDQISEGEADDVSAQLPKDLGALWALAQ
jgi:uncharacterized protein (DUF2267 family)